MKPSNPTSSRSQFAVTSPCVSRLAAFAFVLALPWGSSASAATATFGAEGTFTWTCPDDVTSVTVECWGGGGAGGGASRTSAGIVAGGGGKGGAYAKKAAVSVIPGTIYNVTIPAAATCPTTFTDNARYSGSAVSFTSTLNSAGAPMVGGATVTAPGGQGGVSEIAAATTSGAAGTTAIGGPSVSDGLGAEFAGGNGSAAIAATGSGAGGGGAGSTEVGQPGATPTAAATAAAGGTGGTVGGGKGGNGIGGANVGNAGNNAGGGGSGGRANNATNRIGGAGSLGQIKITYDGGPPVVKADNSNSLNSGTSWVLGNAPIASDVVKWDSTVMSGANTTVLGADTTWAGILIVDPAGLVTINAGNLLTLGASSIDIDIDMSGAAQNLTLNCDVALGAANLWNVANTKTLTLGGAVSGTGPLTTQGLGTVILSADNSYSDGTTVSAGTTIVGTGGTSGSLGSGSVTGGGILAFNRTDAVSVPNRIFGTSAATVPKLEIRSGTVTLANIADNTSLGATVKSGATLVLGATSSTPIHAVGVGGTVESGGILKLAGTGGDQLFDSADPTINGTFDMAGLSETVGGISGSGFITNTTAATSATLTIGGGNSPGNFSGTISDGPSGASGLSLVKIGTNTQVVSGVHTYTGTTAVNGGILNLVTGTGLTAGASTTDTTVAAAGTLRTTVTTPGQNWNLGGDLTLDFDSGIQFDFLSATPSTTIAPLTVENLNNGGTIEISLLNLNVTALGDYPLIAFTAGPPDATGFLLPTVPLNVIASLKIVGTQLVLDVDEIHASTSLTWTNGAATGVWNKTTGSGPGNLNWKSVALDPTSFYDTDSVTFDTTAPVGAITASLTNPVNVTGITVSGPDNVTVTPGGGSISGTGGVTMNGTGTLDLQMDNSFTGKTVINSGTVVLSSSTNINDSNSSLGAIPTVATNDQITINGGTLVPTTNPTPAFTLNARSGVFIGAAGGTIAPPTGKRLSIGKFTSDTAAVTTIGGDGTLAFGGAQLGYLGKWILKGSVLTVAGEDRFGTVDGGAEPDNIKLDGGHIQTTAATPGVTFDDTDRGITLTASGGRLSSSAANNGIYQIVIAGNLGGNLRIGDPLNTNNGQKITFNAAHTYNGKTFIDRGILALGASGSINNSSEIVLGSAATTFDVSSVSAFELGSGQTLSGTGSVLGSFTSSGTIAPGAASTGAISFSGGTMILGTGSTLKIEVEDAQTPAVDSITVIGNLNITDATLNLDINGALTASAYVIATYTTLTGPAFFSITGDAIPAGYELKYAHNGNQIALVQPGGFGPWIASFFGSETNPTIVGTNADPDNDGVANIVEFALGGSAPNSGSARPSLFNQIVSDRLTLTVPVLDVATFAGSPLSATVQGVTITAEGSSTLAGFPLAVETTTVNPNAPAAPTGYTNQTFRLVQTVTGNPSGFLRMSVR